MSNDKIEYQCNFFDVFSLTVNDKYKLRINLIDNEIIYYKGRIFESLSKLFTIYLFVYVNKPLILELIEEKGLDSLYKLKIGICKTNTLLNVEKEKNLFRFMNLKWAKEAYLKGTFRIKYSIEYLKEIHNLSRKDNEHILQTELNTKTIFNLSTNQQINAENVIVNTSDLNVNKYILCFSYEFDDRLFDEFQVDACLVITDTIEFERRFERILEYYDFISTRIFYNNQIHPYGVFFNKKENYSIQKEVRFSWTNFNNPIICTENDLMYENVKWISEKMNEYVDIEIGSLEDISFVIDKEGNKINFKNL